jgi:hypothetical protein
MLGRLRYARKSLAMLHYLFNIWQPCSVAYVGSYDFFLRFAATLNFGEQPVPIGLHINKDEGIAFHHAWYSRFA